MEPEPAVVDVLAPCDGAATALLPAASVNDVAPRTSTAATASEDAVPHHIRPAVLMAFQRAPTFIMTFRMTTSFSLKRSVNPRCHGAVRRMLGICGCPGRYLESHCLKAKSAASGLRNYYCMPADAG
jgi:hypothetical protein